MKAFVNTFVFNQMNVNTHVLWNSVGDCVLIDPGCSTVEEQEILTGFISQRNLRPLAILLTHGHFDHIAGISFLGEKYSCECWLHPNDVKELHDAHILASLYKEKMSEVFRVHNFFSETSDLTFGGFHLRVLHLPGHTEGSVCLYETELKYLFAGDTLMKGSLGFSNSGYEDLLFQLKRKIYPLPASTIIFCGHGPSTTIEEEKKNNLFFRLMKD
jgi:hydroxyacylglutathione hydrolase